MTHSPEHIPCVAIVVAVCAVVLCVALSFWIDGIFGAGGGADVPSTQMGKADQALAVRPKVRPTRTIPNEQAKRRAMWAKIVRKM